MDTDGHEGMPHAKHQGMLRLLSILYYYCSFSCFFREDFSFINGYELPNDILCPSRSDDNRRAAGAVGFCSWLDFFFHQSSLLEIAGPAARHSVYSVCSVDSKMLIFRTTIVYFLVFLKRFSLKPRATA